MIRALIRGDEGTALVYQLQVHHELDYTRFSSGLVLQQKDSRMYRCYHRLT